MGRNVLDKVAKRFGDVEVIPPLDLAIENGQFEVFVGPSGCGKSTLLRVISGLVSPSAGEIRIDGRNVNAVSAAARGCAMVFQSYALYPHMTVYDNMFHGNKDNLVQWGEIVSQLSVYEYNIYIFDYRGYGKSTGSPSECGVLHDSEVIFNNINQKFPDEHWIFYGRSLGTGIAGYLSSKCKPKGLILESPYYSMEELITHYYFPYPCYDQKITIPTHSYLKESTFPVLILHGTGDQIVPIEEGQKLFHCLSGIPEVVWLHLNMEPMMTLQNMMSTGKPFKIFLTIRATIYER